MWDGGSYGEEALLRSCYDTSLKLAWDHGCESVAFPLIATNNYGFPREKALQIALSAFSEFLLERELQIYLVVFDRGSFRLSEKLFHRIESYIDDHYVSDWLESVYGTEQAYRQQIPSRRRDLNLYRDSCPAPMPPAPAAPSRQPSAPKPAKKRISLADMHLLAGLGFSIENVDVVLNHSTASTS